MASYTQIPYVEIIADSFAPALIYFLSVAFFVRIEAKRSGVHHVETETQSMLSVLVSGWHYLIPLAVLVTLLVMDFTPTYAAGISIISVVVASWLSPNRMGVADIFDALAQGARNMATTAVLLTGIGLVVNVISTTGIGNTFSLMINDWANGSLFMMLVLVAVASLILGMGLPVTASYIVLGTLSAPAIYGLIAEQQLLELLTTGQLPEEAKTIFMLIAPEQLAALGAPMSFESAIALVGIVPDDFKATLLEQSLGPVTVGLALLSAHLIIFWLSQDSNVTPPVCLTAFAAATIAKTPPMATGFTAWKIAKGLYIVPLLMAYTPLVSGDFQQVVVVTGFSILGTWSLIACLEGYLEGPINIVLRAVAAGLAAIMMWPGLDITFRVVGAALFIALLLYSRKQAAVVTA